MNDKELETVMGLNASKRYEYFIKKVVDAEEIWGLFSKGWVEAEDNHGNRVLPFWPKWEFANVSIIDEWNNCIPKSITLDEFINKWIPGMQKDGMKPCIFYTDNDRGIIVDINTLFI